MSSEESQKLIIRCSTLTENKQKMNLTHYSKGDYQLSGGNSNEKSINHKCQAIGDQTLEGSKATTVKLYEIESRSSENSINQWKKSDEKQLDQMVTPVHIPTCMCYQTDPNNEVTKKTDESNKIDLQQGWSKAVSFITNTSNKFNLANTLRSLAQIPVVTKIDNTKENNVGEQSDLDNVGFISDSSYTFFL